MLPRISPRGQDDTSSLINDDGLSADFESLLLQIQNPFDAFPPCLVWPKPAEHEQLILQDCVSSRPQQIVCHHNSGSDMSWLDLIELACRSQLRMSRSQVPQPTPIQGNLSTRAVALQILTRFNLVCCQNTDLDVSWLELASSDPHWGLHTEHLTHFTLFTHWLKTRSTPTVGTKCKLDEKGNFMKTITNDDCTWFSRIRMVRLKS